MATHNKFTEIEQSQIVNSYAMGVTQESLAVLWGTSRRSIYRVLVKRAVITPDYTRDMMKLLKKHNISYSYLKELLEG